MLGFLPTVNEVPNLHARERVRQLINLDKQANLGEKYPIREGLEIG